MEKLKLIDAESLYFKPLMHPKMLIEGILPNGLAMLSGDSKIGKSWLVLWLGIKISKGESVWGKPTAKADVIYLALEDTDGRVQRRMYELTDEPPDNLWFGFSCGMLGKMLEDQIEDAIKEHPSAGLLIIDTLQMVRENTSVKTNQYAQDYKDMSRLKQIADNHQICILLVHHTKKEKDSSNVFNNSNGSSALMGAPDTCMILQKDDRFSNKAVLSITGRDVEERQLKMELRDMIWVPTEETDPKELRKTKIPAFIYKVVDYMMGIRIFKGTITDLLNKVGEKQLQPNVASRMLAKYYSDVLHPLGIELEFNRSAKERLVTLTRNDNDDEDDGKRDTKTKLLAVMTDRYPLSLPNASSQSSSPSQDASQLEIDLDEHEFLSSEKMDRIVSEGRRN